MGTVFSGRQRRGRAIRAAVALAAAVLAMDLGRDVLGRVRARVVGWAARPLAARFSAGATRAALSPDAVLRRDLARASLYSPAASSSAATALVPVLAVDLLRHSLVFPVPAGRAFETKPGASVTDGVSLLGFVERVDFGLARCRLLGERGLTVAAETSGASPVRFALVAGGPRGLRIRYATDLDGVPADAPVVTAPIPDPGAAGLSIGRTMASNGGPVADAVTLAADPALVAVVSIVGDAGAAGAPAVDPLIAYDRVAAHVAAAGDASPYRSSFLVVADEPLRPGALVEAEGVVVGRVAESSPGSVARVVRTEDPGFFVEAFLLPLTGGPPLARLRLRGVGARDFARVEAISGSPDAAARGGILVTAPDDGLAPPGLAIGTIAAVPRIEAGDRVAVAFDGESLVFRGATVSAWRFRSPLGSDEESAP